MKILDRCKRITFNNTALLSHKFPQSIFFNRLPQGPPDGGCQIICGYRLHEVFTYPLGLYLFFIDEFTVSRTKNNRHILPEFQYVVGQFHAAHVRHVHIRDNQVEVVSLLLKYLPGLHTRRDCGHLVAQTFENMLLQLDNGRLIINYQQTFMPPTREATGGASRRGADAIRGR